MQAGLHIRITRRLSLFIGNWSFCVGQCWSSSSSNKRFARPHFSVEFQLQEVLKSRWARLKTSRKLWAPPAHRLVPELVTFGLGSFTIPLRGSQGSNFDPYPLRLVPFRTAWKTYLYFKDYFKDIFYLLLSYYCQTLMSEMISSDPTAAPQLSAHVFSPQKHGAPPEHIENISEHAPQVNFWHLYTFVHSLQQISEVRNSKSCQLFHSHPQQCSGQSSWWTLESLYAVDKQGNCMGDHSWNMNQIYTHCLHPLCPRWVQGGSKVGPRWVQGGSKVGPRWVQGGSKVGPRWVQSFQWNHSSTCRNGRNWECQTKLHGNVKGRISCVPSGKAFVHVILTR